MEIPKNRWVRIPIIYIYKDIYISFILKKDMLPIHKEVPDVNQGSLLYMIIRAKNKYA